MMPALLLKSLLVVDAVGVQDSVKINIHLGSAKYSVSDGRLGMNTVENEHS